ncbi:hypothetical protein B0H19DRAFT_1148728 [Mycena capillaripes]|nr:hypothetical protein B0H19DRAFT_1148728 [Mycena capillaripes]
MDLPQGLIDSIVDAVVDDLDLARDPWIVENTPDVLKTLKSCALVARAFVRPCQVYIFHGIAFSDDAPTLPLAFSTLLMQRPYLASYVRAINFESSLTTVQQNVEPIQHLLASVTNLARLDIHPDLQGGQLPWQTYPEPTRASLHQQTLIFLIAVYSSL